MASWECTVSGAPTQQVSRPSRLRSEVALGETCSMLDEHEATAAELPHGLPLSRESLDYVLQRSRCVEDSFSHVRRAVRLMAGQSVRKAIGKRKRDECNE